MAEKKDKKKIVTVSLSNELLERLDLVKSRSKFINDFLLFFLEDLDDEELLELLRRLKNNDNAYGFLVKNKLKKEGLEQTFDEDKMDRNEEENNVKEVEKVVENATNDLDIIKEEKSEENKDKITKKFDLKQFSDKWK
jgi:hypothetical protein